MKAVSLQSDPIVCEWPVFNTNTQLQTWTEAEVSSDATKEISFIKAVIRLI